MSAQAAEAPVRRVKKSTYFFGALGGLLFGYDLGIVAGALLFITPAFHLSTVQTGMVTSSLLVGAAVSAIGCGPVTDRIGRRMVVLISAVLFAVGAIGAALSPGFVSVLIFRVVMGIAVGAASVNVPVYLSEIAPARHRGALSGLNQLNISTGILLAYLVNLGLSHFGAWRWMFGLGALPAVLLFIGGYFQPESPRWLVKKGREAEARAVLSQSREPEELEAELAEINAVNEAEKGRKGFREVFADRRLRSLLVLGVGLAFLQQVVGINTIIYYAPTILQKIGFGTSAAIAANAGLGVLTVLVTASMLFWVVDRVGRRKPLIWGALGMGASMALLAVLFYSGALAGGALGYLAIVALAGFKVSFSLSWGGLVWIILGEIYPLRVRGAAMGLATAANWIGNILIAQFFPVMLGGVGNGAVFVIFAVISVIACGFAYLRMPETKGRTLEELERELEVTAVPATVGSAAGGSAAEGTA
ncbi:MAG: sugar porter family MFS transporter [Nocardiopsaceae bacterium]|nr:sugar porter family MFS transporter [Nocardiopsaceae bacterium]